MFNSDVTYLPARERQLLRRHLSILANLTEVSEHTGDKNNYPSLKPQRPTFQIQDTCTYVPARIALKQTTTWDRLIHVSLDKSTERDNV